MIEISINLRPEDRIMAVGHDFTSAVTVLLSRVLPESDKATFRLYMPRAEALTLANAIHDAVDEMDAVSAAKAGVSRRAG